MQRIRRGQGTRKSIRRLIQYQFSNKNATLICSSNVLAARDAQGLVDEIYDVTSTIGLDIEKPLWHNSLRLKPGEFISAELWVDVVREYMVRMGFDSDNHQWFAVLSDDPDGQHVHITANRMGIDGTLYLGQNENLISTRITQELERKFHLRRTKGPQYVLGKDGKLRVSAPRERRAKKDEVELHARLEREGRARPMPRKALQRVLRAALFAGQAGGLAAFLAVAESGGVRVLANVAATGRASGLSFEANGVPFKGSQLGDAYSWAKLSDAVGFEQARDQALLEARSLRHVTRDQLPPLGQPAPSTQLPTPPAAANPIVISPPAAREAADHVAYQSAYRAQRPAAEAPRRLARSPALDRLRSLPRSGLDDLGGRAGRLSKAQGLLPRDALMELREPVESSHGLRHPAGGVADSASGRGLTRDPSLLDEAREAQAVRNVFDRMHDEIVGTEVVRVMAISASSALADFRAKDGKLGTLYIRESTDTYAFIATDEAVKVARVEPDIVRAALAVAEGQWQTLTIRGSDAFKRMAAREAMLLGLADRIANPELQPLIAAMRAAVLAPSAAGAPSRLRLALPPTPSGQPARNAPKSPNSRQKPIP